MHYILDALNIIYKQPALADMLKISYERAATGLLSLINQYSMSYPSYIFTVVFDGLGLPISSFTPAIYVLNAGKKPADEEIKRLVSFEINPSTTIVVSSDTEVYNFARINACRAMTSEDFLKMAGSAGTRQAESGSGRSMISKKEYNEMLALFKRADMDDSGLPGKQPFLDNPLTDKEIEDLPIKGKIAENPKISPKIEKIPDFTETLKDLSDLKKYSDNPKKIKKSKNRDEKNEKPSAMSSKDFKDLLDMFK